MKKIFLFFFIILLTYVLAVPLRSALGASPEIFLSEVLVGTEKASDSNEFIELINLSAAPVDLSHFRLRYRNSKGVENSLAVIKSNSCIPAQGYFLWANSKGTFASLANITTATTLTDNYTVLLYAPEETGGTLLDSVAWGAETIYLAPVTQSLTRTPADLSWLSLTEPTPTGSTLDVCPAPEPPSDTTLPPQTYTIRINEVFPNPAAKNDAGEFIELVNFSDIDQDISGWTIRDATKTGRYVFPTGTTITQHALLVVTDQDFKLSLNNTNETITLFDAIGAMVATMSYEKTKEDVSLNYTTSGWRGGTPTPGQINHLNNLPKIKERVPKEGYRDIPVAFSASGKDADKQKLKYTWDFGDGHKSYQAEPSHAYAKNGTYTLRLTTTDGVEDVVETFTLKIRSYQPPEVRITALLPNPAGSDLDQEWISIVNREKKEVNLKDWSIATGWKNLVNHPIREDFIIAPKQETHLTRTSAFFTLPNQKGKIELRAPNGKTIQTIRYQLDAPAADGVVYQKIKGQAWAWQKEPTKPAPSNIIPTASPPDQTLLPKPEESPPPETNTSENIPADPLVLGAQTTTEKPTHPEFLALLNYGTQVNLPANIHLSFTNPETDTMITIQHEHYAIVFAKKILAKINTSLNEWQNKTEK